MSDSKPSSDAWPRWTLPGAGVLLAVTAAILLWMGRRPLCACDTPWWPWSWDTWGVHNSQHILDPYALSHILHGVLFYLFLWGALKWWTTSKQRLLLAMGLEAVWEVFENTPYLIEQYRAEGVDYYGDSVLNSMADIGWCALGYLIALWIPSWGSALFFVFTEVFMLWWIKDSLILNIILLTYPVDAIKEWQASSPAMSAPTEVAAPRDVPDP
jgi:hypothetical protein